MSENMNRDWRRKRRQRGVSPIIATILLVAITVVLAAVLYILISGLTKGPGNTPIGTALALAPPKEAAAGAGATTNHWYNFSVQSASSGLTMNSMNFQVQTTGAGVVTPLAAWTVNVLGISGTSVAVYSMTTGVWTSGATTALISGDTIVLDAVQAASISGNNWVVSGAGSYQGTIAVSIP
jgi:flagellin-like protein